MASLLEERRVDEAGGCWEAKGRLSMYVYSLILPPPDA